MERQKVYVFSTAYLPFVGGAEIAIQEVSRRLKNRFDFTIVTARMRRGLPKREVRPEGTVIRLGFGMRFDKWLLPLFALWKLKIGNWKIAYCGAWISHKDQSPRRCSNFSFPGSHSYVRSSTATATNGYNLAAGA